MVNIDINGTQYIWNPTIDEVRKEIKDLIDKKIELCCNKEKSLEEKTDALQNIIDLLMIDTRINDRF